MQQNSLGLCVLGILLAGLGCTEAPTPQPEPTPTPTQHQQPRIVLTDVSVDAGITHPVLCGTLAKHDLIDTNGTGAAVLDVDQDGLMDLYVVNGSNLELWDDGPTPNLLYRNLGDGRFAEEAAQRGVADTAWGSGALAWDYDNDGDSDLYVTNYGPNRLYRNDGGVFAEVAAVAGLEDDGWSMGAAAADLDRDGDLDLYVAHYFVFDPADPPRSVAYGGTLECKWREADVACGPIDMVPEHDRLYRNEGDGTFAEITQPAGIAASPSGYGMGVVWIDADGDQREDVYVACDASANLLFLNFGDGRFREKGDWTGLSLGLDGVPQSGMGVNAGDLDNDGAEELFVANYSHQTNALYRGDGGGMFEECAAITGLGDVSYRFLGWGAAFFDADSDGDLDIYVGNGHVYPEVDWADPTTSYRQRDLLFLNNGFGSFDRWQPPPASPLDQKTSSRSVVRVDYDNDGDSDLLVVMLDAPAQLLRNDTAAAGSWLGIELVGTSGSRDAAGARVEASTAQGTQLRVKRLGSSYMSSEDPRLLFGLADATEAEVTVHWPGGAVEPWGILAAGRYYRLVEGSSPQVEER